MLNILVFNNIHITVHFILHHICDSWNLITNDTASDNMTKNTESF